MKNLLARLFVCLSAMSATLCASSALASHTTTFTGNIDDDWHKTGNWNDGVPNSTARAKIPAGLTVRIKASGADGVADSVEILAGGTLIIEDGRKLTLTYDTPRDSVVDGEIQLEKGSELFIENSLTIEGDGGAITGLSTGGTNAAKVNGTDSSTLLTIASSVAAGSARADSLVVRGLVEIRVKLRNDAYVVADNGNLTLSNFAKEGDDGFWVVENDATLIVNASVSGASTWKLIDDQRATLQFNTACNSLTGDLDFTLGTVDVNSGVTSTGNLFVSSLRCNGTGEPCRTNGDCISPDTCVNTGKPHPRFDVASGASVGISFGQ